MLHSLNKGISLLLLEDSTSGEGAGESTPKRAKLRQKDYVVRVKQQYKKEETEVSKIK